jgi:hypothetical protein
MHNHAGCSCDHTLKHCVCCDVVYCVKCSKEWKRITYDYFPNYKWNYGTLSNQVLCSGHATTTGATA